MEKDENATLLGLRECNKIIEVGYFKKSGSIEVFDIVYS